jgi:hypothetical protein
MNTPTSKRERLEKAFRGFINYDQTTDERWHNRFDNDSHYARVDRDVKKLAEIAIDITES